MAATPKTAAREFVRIAVRLPAEAAERVAAEAYEVGAVGLEELEDAEPGFVTLDLYVPADRAGAVADAVGRCLPAAARILPGQPVDPVDWSETWRAGLSATSVSPRLEIRPPFIPASGRVGQASLVIEPGQAFGTGGHASTRLALELLAELPSGRLRGARLLDVGTGSGVLALAALLLGARCAVGFDVDSLAAPAARANALRNGLLRRAHFFTGTADAVSGIPFDVVVANLLRREAEPLLVPIASWTRDGGLAIFSGLVASERENFAARLEAVGFDVLAWRTREDPTGDCWLGILTRR